MSDRPEIGTKFTAKAVKLGTAKRGTVLKFRLATNFRGKKTLAIKAATPQEAMVKSNAFFKAHPSLRPKRKHNSPKQTIMERMSGGQVSLRGSTLGKSPLTEAITSGLRDTRAGDILDCMSEVAAAITAGVSAVRFADFSLIPFVLGSAQSSIEKCRKAIGHGS